MRYGNESIFVFVCLIILLCTLITFTVDRMALAKKMASQSIRMKEECTESTDSLDHALQHIIVPLKSDEKIVLSLRPRTDYSKADSGKERPPKSMFESTTTGILLPPPPPGTIVIPVNKVFTKQSAPDKEMSANDIADDEDWEDFQSS